MKGREEDRVERRGNGGGEGSEYKPGTRSVRCHRIIKEMCERD